MLDHDFGHVDDVPQALSLGALPLVDGLVADGVPQLLFPLAAIFCGLGLKAEERWCISINKSMADKS